MKDYKKKDKEAIVCFMTGKDAVEVADIIANSGANNLRVYPILAELRITGQLEIVETETMGAPKIVRLK